MKNKILVLILIVGVFFGLTACTTVTQEEIKPNSVEVIETKKAMEITEKALTHTELLEISNANYKDVINKTYTMTLYLEQAPSTTQAEFMSQPEDNSMDTLLVTCNMNTEDLQKLDGDSAQKRVYKPYNLKVKFTEYNSNVGLYYKAICTLI